MTAFSILDLCPVVEGGTVPEALDATRQMARQAEASGFTRFWLAEHHGMTGIASAATSLVISEAARATKTIRVGSGGIMLPNHSPLVIAEQFGTLEALYPGRIDLGLGRAPGTDMNTARALRRNLEAGAETFPNDIVELQTLMSEPQEGQRLIANPGAGANVPIYILGSSTYSAHLAAMLGLPYAFASHFAPDMLFEALHIYRSNFRPSNQLDKPYVIVGVMAALADTDEEADYHFTSALQSFVALRRNARGKTPRPVESMDGLWTEMEKMSIEHTFQFAIVGGPEKAKAKMERFVADTKADEVIISVPVHSVEARLKSVAMFGEMRGALKQAA
ncbi:LLM class flavin-dependent oxidoreductase [Martelella endophytica]|uniref:Luciferase-like monooxygenase n=1 Tax=Martelella endophytica TaxID=1486262 RepID=A0A0D5LR25_MAREN|nr:LLM class flavin-dependent oxidoreductase [Martelella endophytica]AJY46370.1 alkane 1-monooxygenase [Martelella endophytica]